MFDTMVEFMGYPLTFTRHTGSDQEPVGLGSPAVVPYGSYRTGDGHTAVLGTTNDAEWKRLCAMIDRPDLAAMPEYARNADRVQHRAELDAAVGSWCGTRTLAEVQDAADAAGIGNARYNLPSDVIAHPHLAARDRWQQVDTPAGPITAALPPPVFGASVPAMGAVPGLGEHTRGVLAELEYDAAAVAALAAAGVIGLAASRDLNS
jgi:itaconate CoA-transferase